MRRQSKSSLIRQIDVISAYCDAQGNTIAVLRIEITRLLAEVATLQSRIDNVRADLQTSQAQTRESWITRFGDGNSHTE